VLNSIERQETTQTETETLRIGQLAALADLTVDPEGSETIEIRLLSQAHLIYINRGLAAVVLGDEPRP
jgi:hypothetical protein